MNQSDFINRFTLSQMEQIVALPSGNPKDYGIEMENWTYDWLVYVAITDKIVDSSSPSYVGAILKKK